MFRYKVLIILPPLLLLLFFIFRSNFVSAPLKEESEAFFSTVIHEVPVLLSLDHPNREPSPITIDKIFDGIKADSDAPDQWSLLVGGDVMVGRSVNHKVLSYNNFDWPYEKITSLISRMDYSFVNLESPVVANCPVRNDGMIFCGDLKHISAIGRAGINAVSLANNHALNQGRDGLNTTIDYLQRNNITPVGVDNPTYAIIENQRVALLGYTDIECYEGVACVNYEKIKSDLSIAKANSDLVIVMYHWGAEYRDYPVDRQIEIAHLSIDAGADLVLGNHPHWIQPFEIYTQKETGEDKLIMYSHGNLVFDQMWSQKTREGVLVEYIFNKSNLIDAEIYPVQIEDYGQPRLLEGEFKSKKLEFIKEITEKMAAQNL